MASSESLMLKSELLSEKLRSDEPVFLRWMMYNRVILVL